MLDAAMAARIRLLVLDVDGVLTDNAVYLGSVHGQRAEYKRFDVQDGLGIVLLRYTGIEVVWVSARPSGATTLRAEELRVGTCVQDAGGHKLAAVESLLADRRLAWDEVACVGDDLADLPLLRRAGLAIAVPNAVPEVRALASHVTLQPGGHGAVREVVTDLLRARGEYDRVVEQYLLDQGDAA